MKDDITFFGLIIVFNYPIVVWLVCFTERLRRQSAQYIYYLKKSYSRYKKKKRIKPNTKADLTRSKQQLQRREAYMTRLVAKDRMKLSNSERNKVEPSEKSRTLVPSRMFNTWRKICTRDTWRRNNRATVVDVVHQRLSGPRLLKLNAPQHGIDLLCW